MEGRKRRGIELKPHVLPLPVSSDDELADNGSFEVRARDGVDDFGIIGDNAFRYLLADAVFLDGPPRRLHLWKLRHCSLFLANSSAVFPRSFPVSFFTSQTRQFSIRVFVLGSRAFYRWFKLLAAPNQFKSTPNILLKMSVLPLIIVSKL